MSINRLSGAQTATTAGRPIRRGDFFWPLAVIGALTLLMMTLGIHFVVGAFDRASEAREQTLAGNGITQRIAEVALLVVPQTDWDDAVRNLDNKFDASWAETNIGKFFNQTDGFDQSYVLDADDKPVFASAQGARVDISKYKPIETIAAGLIRSVREQEAHRPPLKATVKGGMVSKPIQASGLKLVDGGLAIMTATLVQPDFGTAMGAGPRAPVVVTLMQVDPDFLGQFAKRYLLSGLHVRKLGEALRPGETTIPAQDEHGRTIAHFSWQPLNPGYQLLRRMLPPIGIACAVLLLVAITQLRRIFRFADQLIAREAEPRIPGGEDGLVPFHIFYEQLKLEIASLGDGADALAIHSVCFEGLEDLDDGFGEGSAEAFMRIAALRLRAACREGTLLTRHVGNSIAILSLGSNGVEAEALSGRLVQTMSSPVALEGGLVNFHCAVGSVVVDERGADPDDVLHKAEAACRKVVMV